MPLFARSLAHAYARALAHAYAQALAHAYAQALAHAYAQREGAQLTPTSDVPFEERLRAVGDGAGAHGALVDVECGGQGLRQHLFAHAEAGAHAEEDACAEAALGEL